MAIIVSDSTGQLWQITANPDGSLETTPVAGTGTTGGTSGGGPSTTCTVTLQSVVNLCMTHVDLMPLANVGGFNQEPALSLCNDVIQELLASPYDWKFNTNVAGMLVTQPNQQDYDFAGAVAFVQGIGGVGIGLASGSAITENGDGLVTVQCLQQHNFSVGQTVFMQGNTIAQYNSTLITNLTQATWTGGWVITAVPNATTFQFYHSTLGLAPSGANGIYDYGWLENATMFDPFTGELNPQRWEVSAVKRLKRSSAIGKPEKMCRVVDSCVNGILTFRFHHIPNFVYAVFPVYQAKAPLKTDLSQYWCPFPDEFGFVYRQAFLARCYRYLNHPRADVEWQKAEAMIAKALDRDDVEESDQYVTPERTIMGDGW